MLLSNVTRCIKVMQAYQAFVGITNRYVPRRATMLQPLTRLLTGWSLVRIRPGEPNQNNDLRQYRGSLVMAEKFSCDNAGDNIWQISPGVRDGQKTATGAAAKQDLVGR